VAALDLGNNCIYVDSDPQQHAGAIARFDDAVNLINSSRKSLVVKGFPILVDVIQTKNEYVYNTTAQLQSLMGQENAPMSDDEGGADDTET
jgi:hypothetical protein